MVSSPVFESKMALFWFAVSIRSLVSLIFISNARLLPAFSIVCLITYSALAQRAQARLASTMTVFLIGVPIWYPAENATATSRTQTMAGLPIDPGETLRI